MKHCVLFILFAFCGAIAHAQTPQWSVSASSGANTYPFNNTSGNKVGWFYVPGDFGAPPNGTITDIYFYTAGAASNATYNSFTIKMGQVTGSGWASTTYPTTGMTTVVSGNPYVIPTVPSGWVKFTLSTPFVYDNTQGLMVLVESQSYSNGFNVNQNSLTARRLYGTYGSTTATGMDGTYAGFGFDIVTCPSPVISAQPLNRNQCEGTSANFSVTATNTSFYQWQVNTGSGFTDITNNATYSGATTSTLTVSPLTMALHNNQYRCKLSGACNNPMNSSVATLTVMPGASIISQTLSDSVCETAATSMSVNVFGSVIGYQWEMAVATVGVFTNIPNSFPYSGTNSPILTILNTPDTLNDYIFRCVVAAIGQCSGVTTAPIPLTVLTPPEINVGGPNDQIVLPYQDAEFTMTVTGQDYVTYWQASADGITYSNINDNVLYKGTKTSSLLVKNPPLSMSNWWFRSIIKSTDPGCGIYHDTSVAAQLKMDVSSSVNDVLNESGVTLSPNPVAGTDIFIENMLQAKKVHLNIIDNLGRTVQSAPLHLVNGSNTVNISRLSPGVYTMRLTDDTGNVVNMRFTRQ
ncbi:MAG: hypothetical protein K0R82_1966 [Flavipsychrobacter sp.]|nr:hypothetical protein [Flavipsychrobacter sp.]